MWPLTGREIVEACEIATWSPAIEDVAIASVALDEGEAAPDALFVALREDGFDGHDRVAAFLEAGGALALVSSAWEGRAALSPAHAERCLLVSDVLVAFRRLAARLRRGFSFPVIAVGGSNGKTTTKDMIAALLAGVARRVTKTPETMNGWSGVPVTLTQREHARAAPPDALVVEIGIDAASAMEDHARLVDADVVVLTALGPEHLEGLGALEDVVREEMKLFELSPRAKRVWQAEDDNVRANLRGVRAGDVVVCGAARDLAALADLTPDVALLTYEVACPAPSSSEVAIAWRPSARAEPTWRATFTVPMAGRHNGDDFALALAAALALGRSPDELTEGFAGFTAPSMRCEVHTLPNDCVLIDDAYNASPSSVHAALDLLGAEAWASRPKIVILGDMLELGAASEAYHLALRERLAALVDEGARVCLFGAAMRAVHRAVEGTKYLAPESDPRAFLDDLSLEGALVLVKGSRGMHLERVTAEIARRASPEPQRHATEDDLLPYRDRFTTACVTGTNGKTTTTSLIAAIVEAAGEPSARVTTLGAWVAGEATGEAPTGDNFLRTLERAAARGVRTLAVETTSHALADGFARSWRARVAVFTNLSRDHLDYHGTPERYLAAKAQLFMSLPPDGVAILNVADPASALLDEVTPPGVRRLGYAARPPALECASIPLALHATTIALDEKGTHATLARSAIADALGGAIEVALIGHVHVENACAAALAGHALGYSFEVIRAALSSFAGVPGRFEIVGHDAPGPTLVVDYAHTPDALARTLSVARSLVAARHGRVVCVFGCGGDRDPGKREEMGRVAADGADVVIVTSDNPRSEDPVAIAEEVEKGANKGAARLVRRLDRREAIAHAVELAAALDIVVMAGKGHEKVQIIGDRELPFDDVEVAREALTSLRSRGERISR
ncbi:MAG: UDP-N-acetylmuramyl-tripeptide synthetase [Labilithrix sp.]|nr:UDP-N-acetylmuramyl-tripeptide synthetase [Labilithrix sp.]